MIELTEEPYDGADAVALVAALNLEINERYTVDGDTSDEDDVNFHTEVTAEMVSRPRGVFVVARMAGRAVGCGALKAHGSSATVAEVKRMFVVPAARRRGVSRAVLERLEQAAVELGYSEAKLETGTAQPEAIALYEDAGWHRIPPFGFYRDSPMSVCFAKDLAAG